jgi:hypothetical protein
MNDMEDSSWVFERFQVGGVRRFELSVGKAISGIAWSRFQWIRGRQNHLWVFAVSDLSFEG